MKFYHGYPLEKSTNAPPPGKMLPTCPWLVDCAAGMVNQGAEQKQN